MDLSPFFARQPPENGWLSKVSRGDSPFPMDDLGPLDIAALAIFPEYIEFDGEEVLKLMVSDPGRTIN